MNYSYTRLHEHDSFPAKFKMAWMKKAALHRQRGVSLFIVLVVLLLALIIVLGGMVVANLNESLVGNQSDAQRAYGAAEALLNAAQRDILLNGRFCDAAAIGGTGTNATIQTETQTGTPAAASNCTARYPREGDGPRDYVSLVSSIGLGKCGTTAGVWTGVCISGDPASAQFETSTINNGTTSNAEQWDNGVDYNNKYISTLAGGANNSDYGNNVQAGSTSLALTGSSLSSSRGKYWVEVFPYNVMSTALAGTPNVPVPDGTYPFVFRITAMAKGLKSGTVSVLRTYYVPYPMVAVNNSSSSTSSSTDK